MSREGPAADQARRPFEAPFVVVSHGTEADPILNYGNRTALQLWEMDAEAFLQTPSRLTAEPLHRDERCGCSNERCETASSTTIAECDLADGQAIIERAIVWNLVDEAGRHRGQAATFDSWTPLPPAQPSG